ncbi:hypothetical protein HZA97_07525 [Candidatus Woesearchaeota archaeon]|nr:hypothetical protein [Candidatus Woesearchaeota archaeon]
MLKRVFDVNNELYVSYTNSTYLNSDYIKKLNSNIGHNFLKNSLEGKNKNGWKVGEVIYLGKKKSFFSGFEYPIEIRSNTNEKIMPARKDQMFSPITIKVYDSSFIESAKTFAKTYTKWCGQEATVMKEYTSTEEKAQEMVRLEGMINSSKEGKKENINQLEPEMTIEKRPSHLYEIDLIHEARAKVEQSIKNSEESKKYRIQSGNSASVNYCAKMHGDRQYRTHPSEFVASINVDFYERGFLGTLKEHAGLIHINISELNFTEKYDKEQVKYKITTTVNSSKHLEYLTSVSTRLKEEFNAPVTIKPNY